MLLFVFQANQTLFHTGWFIESIATQVFAIFVIRTVGNPFKSRPHPVLLLTSLAIVGVAMVLPFTPLATVLGFAPLPAEFFGLLAGLMVVYLVLVEIVKRWFYRRLAARQVAP